MIRQFLLGQLGEGERASIEDRLFDDAGFLDRLLDTEDDLLDAYVRGSLSPCEKGAGRAQAAGERGGERRASGGARFGVAG